MFFCYRLGLHQEGPDGGHCTEGRADVCPAQYPSDSITHPFDIGDCNSSDRGVRCGCSIQCLSSLLVECSVHKAFWVSILLNKHLFKVLFLPLKVCWQRTYPFTSLHHCANDAGLDLWVMVRVEVNVPVSMRGLPVNHSANGSIFASNHFCVQKGESFVFFSLHGEANGWSTAIDVCEEFHELFSSVFPENEGVVHVSQPQHGFRGCRADGFFLERLHEQIGQNGGEGRAHGRALVLLIELPFVGEVGGVEAFLQ